MGNKKTNKHPANSSTIIQTCETLQELASSIIYLGNCNLQNPGMIQGREKSFSSVIMAKACLALNEHKEFRYLTRNYGIRQQAIYILFSENKLILNEN